MMFRKVKIALKDLLTANAAGRFRVAGTQKQSINAEKQIKDLPLVALSSASSDFKATDNSYQVERDATVNLSIKITVAVPVYADLTALNNELSTAAQRATALAESLDICDTANDLIGEISDNVYQIIEDARNYDLIEKEVRDRHISDLTIYDAQRDGQLAVASSVFNFSCLVTEIVDGETGIAADPDGISTGDIKPNSEDTDNAGVIA